MKKAKMPKKALPKSASDESAAAANRRREWRLDLPLSTVIEGKLPHGEKFKERTQLENISSTGAYFTLASSVVVGSKLNIIIDLPENLTEGRPVKLQLGGAAVRLEEVGEADKKHGVAVRFQKGFKFVTRPKAKKAKKA